jgi:EAL domain-containing protein (putative c-di-GMP-specific phosphodiesterase class I)
VELRIARDDEQLVVHLQPQVSLIDDRVVGVEALVRWNHPVRGLLSPADLLPAAEQAGLLRPLTDTVLELALTAAARWWRDRAVPVSVNLAAANVNDLDLPSKVAAALRRPSTTTAPATARWPTCGTYRPTSSSSTGA